MATVYVVTAGGGDTYRIERVYLDRDEADRFAQGYNGTAPLEPVQVEEWEACAPPGAYDGPYWRAQCAQGGGGRPVQGEGGGIVLGHDHPGQS